ncbi:MAG: ABC transporter substrate-binding protein [Myxococcota bacterium]|nr:ABC transporter substrate-binding protein [Myxococcota bacterium]
MRIASLLPSATEIVASLGLEEFLVGVSHECDFPATVMGLPVLTSSILDAGLSPVEIDRAVQAAGLEHRPLYRVDGDLLSSLQPDLILTQGVCAVCAVTEETIQESLRLLPIDRACSAPVLSLEAKSYGGIQEDLRAVAQALGKPSRGEEVCAAMDRRWHGLQAPAARPRVLMLEWADPPWSAGHWVPEQVRAAGGENLLGEGGGDSRRLDWGEVVAADPDCIVSISCGFDLQRNIETARALYDHPVAGQLRALRGEELWAADANSFFSRPAPRVVRGAELLGRLFQRRAGSETAEDLVRVRRSSGSPT